MFVPDQDSAEYWNQQVYLDAGEYLHDGLVQPLAPGIDCPSTAQFFDGINRSDRGVPILKSNLACLFERTTGDPAWRHYENGVISGRPSRELVLRTVAVVGNYDYIMDWVFRQNGSIKVAVGATGVMATKGVEETHVGAPTSDGQRGVLVGPNTLAVNHDHFFSFRLDLDVDGQANSFMIDKLVPEVMKSNTTRTSLWTVHSEMAQTEKDAILDYRLENPKMWMFVNSQHKSPLGHESGYMIMPGATAVTLMSPEDPAQKVAAFAEHQLWVTPYKANELYAAGTYVTSSEGKDGLAAWTKANRPIMNADIVAWYTLGFHHVPSVEDWPVMPVLWHDFEIRPYNFFTENPTLTLPRNP
jgi:primary-amine oxidase